MIVGIDQGTTGTTGILLDLEGNVVDSRYAAHQQVFPRAGWVEHDPLEIWSNVESIARALARKSDGKLLGIGIANQGETVLAWDRKTSAPLGNAIVWQDTRSLSLIHI